VKGGSVVDINSERLAGLLLSRQGVLRFGDRPGEYPRTYEPVPQSFTVEWYPSKGVAALVGDSSYVALLDYKDGNLLLRPEYNHQHTLIEQFLSE
jgi:hypothetical protein